LDSGVFVGQHGAAGLLALSWKWKMLVGSAGGVSGLIAVLLGRSAETPATKKQEAEADWQTKLLNLASKLAAPVFVVLFRITISFGMSWLLEELWSSGVAESSFALPGPFMTDPRGTLRLIYATDWIVVAIAIVALAAFGTVMSWFININRFSLHSDAGSAHSRVLERPGPSGTPIRSPVSIRMTTSECTN
jgi:hypothetical protein